MKHFIIATSLIFLVISLSGCVKFGPEELFDYQPDDYADIDIAEMHHWDPPSEETLEWRRQNQAALDAVSREIDQLFLGFDNLALSEVQLGDNTTAYMNRANESERKLTADIQALEAKNQVLGAEVKAVKTSLNQTSKDFAELIRKMEEAQFRPSEYNGAFTLFRQGKFKASRDQFLRVLGKNHPSHLKDNILFGLGSSYYKLKRYPNAVKYLRKMHPGPPNGDKWFEAQVLLGMIYGLQGQKSQALYILEGAKKKGPPKSLSPLIERLIKINRQGESFGSS